MLARWSMTFGSMAAAIALRTLRFLVGGFDGVGPSALPVHVGAGCPPVQITSMPWFMRSTPPDWAGNEKFGTLSPRAVATEFGARRTPALTVPVR